MWHKPLLSFKRWAVSSSTSNLKPRAGPNVQLKHASMSCLPSTSQPGCSCGLAQGTPVSVCTRLTCLSRHAWTCMSGDAHITHRPRQVGLFTCSHIVCVCCSNKICDNLLIHFHSNRCAQSRLPLNKVGSLHDITSVANYHLCDSNLVLLCLAIESSPR